MAITPGVVSFVASAGTSVQMSATEASGGTAPYTHQWYRGTTPDFTPGAGNILAGQTALTLTDSTAPAGISYYKVIYTDAVSATATSVSVMGSLWLTPAKILAIGDSITLGTANNPNACQTLATTLPTLGRPRQVTVTNQGVGGSGSGDWIPGQPDYTAAVTAGASAGCTLAQIMLGTNDSANGIYATAATHSSNLSQTINDLLNNHGYTAVMIHGAPWCVPGSGNQTEFSDNLITQYHAVELGLCNGKTIIAGDMQAYEYFGENPGHLSDGIHPDQTGDNVLGALWARAWDRYLSTTGGNNGLSIRTTSGWTVYFTVTHGSTIWNTSTQAFEAINSANWANYAIALTESGSTGIYTGTFPAIPATTPTSTYGITAFRKVGASDAATDPDVASLNAGWDGTNLGIVAASSVTGSVGSVTGTVGTVSGSVGSVTGAVGSVAGNVGGNVVGSVASVTGNVGGVAGNVVLASNGLDNVIVEPKVGSGVAVNARQALSVHGAFAGGVLSGATANQTTQNIQLQALGNPTVNRVVATTDENGNRSIVALNLPA